MVMTLSIQNHDNFEKTCAKMLSLLNLYTKVAHKGLPQSILIWQTMMVSTICIFLLWGWGCTVRKVSKYGVFSGPHFPAFGLNTERYEVTLHIQSEYGKIRTKKYYIFGHFSHNGWFEFLKLATNAICTHMLVI